MEIGEKEDHHYWFDQTKKRFNCPNHGLVERGVVLFSNDPRRPGQWCGLCWIDSMEKAGVCRVEETDAL